MEVNLLLIANQREFDVEREVIHSLVLPTIKRELLENHYIAVNIVDVVDNRCGRFPISPDKCVEQLRLLGDAGCLSIPMILIGETHDKPLPQFSLPSRFYELVQEKLKSMNKLDWKVMDTVYTLNKNRKEYILLNWASEEAQSLARVIYDTIGLLVDDGVFTAKDVQAYTQLEFESFVNAIKEKKLINETVCVHRTLKKDENIEELESKDIFLNPQENLISRRCSQLVSHFRNQNLLVYNLSSEKLNCLGSLIHSLEGGKDEMELAKVMSAIQVTRERRWGSEVPLPVNTHLDYLADMTQQLIRRLMTLTYAWVTKATALNAGTEAQSHIEFLNTESSLQEASQQLPKDLNREKVCIDAYLEREAIAPILITGKSGTGKSSLLRYAIRRFESQESSKYGIIVARSINKSCAACTLQGLLDSIIQQIYSFYQPNYNFENVCEYAELVRHFGKSLQLPTVSRPLLLLIDNLDLLYPHSHVELFRWLPSPLTAGNAHIVFTTTEESMDTALRFRFGDEFSLILSPSSLGSTISFDTTSNRLNNTLSNIAQNNPSPMFIQLLHDVTPLLKSASRFPTDIASVFANRLQMIDNPLIKITKYLACSRIGLTHGEMMALMEKDKETTDHFKCCRRGVPEGHLQSLLFDRNQGLADYLTCMKTDRRLVYSFVSEQLRKGAQIFWGMLEIRTKPGKNRKEPEDLEFKEEKIDEDDQALPVSQMVHRSLANFWSIENKFFWTVSQQKRRVSFSEGASNIEYTCNQRKLTEMPYQAIRSGADFSDVCQEMAFSFEYWFGCLTRNGRLNDLFSELYFLRQINQLQTHTEFDLVLTLLRSLASKITANPALLSLEIAGRIGHLAGSKWNDIGQTLLSSIDKDARPVNCLQPLLPVLYKPLLHPEITRVRVGSDSLATLSPDNRFFITLITQQLNNSDESEFLIIIWDARTLTKAQIIYLGKWSHRTFNQLMFPPGQDEYVILKFISKEKTSNSTPQSIHGLMVVNLNKSFVENTYKATMNHQLYVLQMTRHTLTIAEGTKNDGFEYVKVIKFPGFNAYSARLKKVPKPCLVVHGERYIIGPANWSTDEKNQERSETKKELYNLPLTSMQVKLMSGLREPICRLDLPAIPVCLTSSIKGDFVVIGAKGQGHVFRFDLNQLLRMDARRLKPNLEFRLLETLEKMNNKSQIRTIFHWGSEIYTLLVTHRDQITVTNLVISPDEYYLAVEYSFGSRPHRIACVWSLINHQLVTGFHSYGSCFRFGVDNSGGELIHCILDSPDFSWVELIKLTHSIDRNVDLTSVQPSKQKIELNGNAIREARFILGGKLLICTGGEIILTSSANASQLVTKTSNTMHLEQYIGCCIQTPLFQPSLDFIYSRDPRSGYLVDLFSFHNCRMYSLISQPAIEYDDMLADLIGGEMISDEPIEKHFSSDGRSIAFVYDLKNFDHKIPDKKASTLRKPSLPGVNYYTGVKNNEYFNTTVSSAYRQTVVKLFCTALQDSGSSREIGLLSTISLCGEDVFMLSSTCGLLTVKPDHSNNQEVPESPVKRNFPVPKDLSQVLISRYSINTGKFEGYCYIPHPMKPGFALVSNEKYLVVSCGNNGTSIRVLKAPTFQLVHKEIDIGGYLKMHDELNRPPQVDRIFCCESAPLVVVAKYSWSSQETKNQYIRVDLSENTYRCFTTNAIITDVCSYGNLAVDADFKLYNVVAGELLKQLSIQHVNSNPTPWQAKISSDSSYIVGVGKDGSSSFGGEFSLLIIKNNPALGYPKVGQASLQPIAQDYDNNGLHVLPNIFLGACGRLVCIVMPLEGGKGEFKAFIINDNEDGKNEQNIKRRYLSAEGRIQHLLHRVLKANDSKETNRRQKVTERLHLTLKEFSALV